SPVFTDMALSAIDGNLVMPVVGWYDHAPAGVTQLVKNLFGQDFSSTLFRFGGHVFSLVQAQSYLASVQPAQMAIHDPASSADDNLVTQSPFTTDVYNLQDALGPFGDGYRTQTHVPGMGGGKAYLDEYFAIRPKYGLTADADQLIFLKPIQLSG